MEKGQGPPPEGMSTGPPVDIPAPPYPGPPLDYNVGVNQAQPSVQPGTQSGVYPSTQASVQPGIQPSVQPGIQSGVYPSIQPSVQPGPVIIQQAPYQYGVQQPQLVPVNQVMVVQQLPTDVPGHMTCPVCRNTVVTRIEYRNGMITWLICGILGVFLCWPCCLIPFCVNSCKDVVHYCPTCNNVLHIHKRR